MDELVKDSCPFRHLLSPRFRVVTPVVGEGLTKQSFRDECDINVIMSRYQQSGVLPVVSVREGRFVDAPSTDYQEAMFQVADARSRFERLPARLRERFENDPGKLVAFLADDKNVAEARELGLVNPERVVVPVPVSVSSVNSGTSDPAASGSGSSAPAPKVV